VIESVRIAIADVSTGSRRIRKCVSTQINKVRASIRNATIFKAENLGDRGRRIRTRASGRPTRNHEECSLFIKNQSGMRRKVDLHVDLQ
jgi:hypothetical protein